MNKMIRYFKLILVILLIVLLIITIKPIRAKSDNPVIAMSTEKINDRLIKINVIIVKNSGILAMNLNLVYNKEVMTLKHFEFGEALNSLSPISSNVNTIAGYGIYPFKLSYEGERNDYSTGDLFTLTFEIKENALSGEYKISLDYEDNNGITFLNEGKIETRDILIDSVFIKINKNNTEAQVIKTDDVSYYPYIIVGVVISLIIILVIIYLIKKRKNKSKWVKI